MSDRREFLKKLARGTAYAAPIIYTLSTPRELSAIIVSGMIMIGGMGGSIVAGDEIPGSTAPGSQAPWSAPPPGSDPPGGPPPGGE